MLDSFGMIFDSNTIFWLPKGVGIGGSVFDSFGMIFDSNTIFWLSKGVGIGGSGFKFTFLLLSMFVFFLDFFSSSYSFFIFLSLFSINLLIIYLLNSTIIQSKKISVVPSIIVLTFSFV